MDLKDYTAKCDAESDARTIREQAARIRELEGALEECADVLEDVYTDGEIDVRAYPAVVDMARRILAEGGKP